MPSVKFAVDSDPAEFPSAAGQQIINGFVEPGSKDNARAAEVKAAPGLGVFKDTGDFKCRGNVVLDPHIYSVFLENVYKVDSAGTQTTIGQVPGTGPVFMARNDANVPQIAIITDTGHFYYIENDILQPGPSEGLPNGNWISATYLTQVIVLAVDDGRMFSTGIKDVSTIAGLDFAEAEARPDDLTAAIALGDQLFAFGKETIEPWRFDGSIAIGFPFQRVAGGYIKRGCLAKHAIQELDGTLYFPSHDGLVGRLNGYTFERVSNRAVERDLASVSDPENIRGHAYKFNGNLIYGIKHDNWTWEFNAATSLWHKRETIGLKNWRAGFFVEAFNKTLCGYDDNGKIFELDPSLRTEDGEEIIFEARSELQKTDPTTIVRFGEFHTDIVTGRAAATGTNEQTNPVIMLDWSTDGETWSKARHLSLGRQGQRSQRVYARRLGALRRGSQGVTWRLRCSDPHVVAMSGQAELKVY